MLSYWFQKGDLLNPLLFLRHLYYSCSLTVLSFPQISCLSSILCWLFLSSFPSFSANSYFLFPLSCSFFQLRKVQGQAVYWLLVEEEKMLRINLPLIKQMTLPLMVQDYTTQRVGSLVSNRNLNSNPMPEHFLAQ